MVHTLCGDWPAPDASTCVDPGNPELICPVTEFDRRKCYVDTISLDHPLMDLIQRCLCNNPESRPNMSTMVTEIADIQVCTSMLILECDIPLIHSSKEVLDMYY